MNDQNDINEIIETQENNASKNEQVISDEQKDKISEIERQKDAYLRLLAEFDNFRKRSEREKLEIIDVVKGSVVNDFLPILDSLEKAYIACAKDESISAGIELVIKAFKQLLEKYEIKEVDTQVEFNPHMHEALMTVDSDEPNKIVQVFEKGYIYKDKLLRPAKVSVSKGESKSYNNDNNEEV
ncbi:MAG: nucleotide exchange factor GrpE [Desulfurella sp.]|uniref:nucleotide exchange factor GrpE n=1 Tax=Desulfurella sp. TaxID=1962857 RepID=UPI003CADDF5C